MPHDRVLHFIRARLGGALEERDGVSVWDAEGDAVIGGDVNIPLATGIDVQDGAAEEYYGGLFAEIDVGLIDSGRDVGIDNIFHDGVL